jgi:hypothetical protein
MSGCKSDYDRRDKAAAQMPNTFWKFCTTEGCRGAQKDKKASLKESASKKIYYKVCDDIDFWGLHYKTFYSCNLQIFIIS